MSYRAYWGEAIVELLVNTTEELSIDDIAQKTSITHADVMNTYVVTSIGDSPSLTFDYLFLFQMYDVTIVQAL